MKCIIAEQKVVRVTDEQAKKLVAENKAAYCDKTLWKDTGRKYKKHNQSAIYIIA